MEDPNNVEKSPDLVPHNKLIKVLQDLQGLHEEKKRVVLISTGSYCPVHRMHLECFEIAKKELEKNHAFLVVAGYLSPSHDRYVTGKMVRNGYSSIRGDDRYEMVRLSSLDSPWLEASPWEKSQPDFTDFPAVTKFHANYLRDQISKKISAQVSRNVLIMYLCGADHAVGCFLHQATNYYWCDGVVGIGRPGPDTQELIKTEKRHSKNFYFVQTSTEDVSSTQIRKRILAGESISDLVFPQVEEFMKTNNIGFKKQNPLKSFH